MGDHSTEGNKAAPSLIDDDMEIISKFWLPYLQPPLKDPVKSKKRDRIIAFVKSLALEFKRTPLPKRYLNWPTGSWANPKIRVDNIPASVACCWCRAIFHFVHSLDPCFEDGSIRYTFLTFSTHRLAKKFVEKFNNKQIPGTDMVYQLSWAPFYENTWLHDDERRKNEIIDNEVDLSDAEEDIQQVPSDVHQVPADEQQVADAIRLFSKIRAFHEGFYDLEDTMHEILVTRGGLTYEGVEMVQGLDDGLTKILFLSMVDPLVEEGTMKHIFEPYGKCTVHLLNEKGYGFVKFEKRESAENAYQDLTTVLKDGHVCWLIWCIEREKLGHINEELKKKCSKRGRTMDTM